MNRCIGNAAIPLCIALFVSSRVLFVIELLCRIGQHGEQNLILPDLFQLPENQCPGTLFVLYFLNFNTTGSKGKQITPKIAKTDK
jgi:hypothetical protein